MKKKRLKITDIISSDGEDVLHCPACDGAHLHQTKVEAFERGEDAEEGNHVQISGSTVAIDRNLAGNPSSRRHGLIVYFWCETCSADIRLKMYQHKGNTFLGMEYADPVK